MHRIRNGIASPIVGRAAFVPPKQDMTDILFNQFVKAHNFRDTLSSFFTLCEKIELKEFEDHGTFFKSLKERVRSWRANSLWSCLTPVAENEVYGNGSACAGQRVLIIGAGPCGLRTAIECAFLGAKVVVVEKRDDFHRNNVLHLWPFVIKDLKKLGAKTLYPKFCPGNINHISIRRLQLLLLKICLCLGVEVHQAGFEDLIEPPEDQGQGTGWRAKLDPPDHQLSTFEFDIIIGADGRKNSLKGFERKKAGRALAIAITFNFVNYNSGSEAKVSEIGGLSYQYRRDFFDELMTKHGIALENLVYYKDETHYFVVTAKKGSLLNKGVLKEDKPTVTELLSAPNVDRSKLEGYALELAQFSTTLPKYDFETNHHGGPDVAMFDFTSVFQACHPALIRDKNGHKLLVGLVGDGLYQPFWPQGTGCGRGFTSAFNAAWMIRDWALGEKGPLDILAERESLYLLLPMTPRGLLPAIESYTIDPHTRYVALKTQAKVCPDDIQHLYNPEEHVSFQRKEPESAGPLRATAKSSQKNCSAEDLVSESSYQNGSGLPSDIAPANGDTAPFPVRLGLRKVKNSLVTADAEEEMRRNQELKDTRKELDSGKQETQGSMKEVTLLKGSEWCPREAGTERNTNEESVDARCLTSDEEPCIHELDHVALVECQQDEILEEDDQHPDGKFDRVFEKKQKETNRADRVSSGDNAKTIMVIDGSNEDDGTAIGQMQETQNDLSSLASDGWEQTSEDDMVMGEEDRLDVLDNASMMQAKKNVESRSGEGLELVNERQLQALIEDKGTESSLCRNLESEEMQNMWHSEQGSEDEGIHVCEHDGDDDLKSLEERRSGDPESAEEQRVQTLMESGNPESSPSTNLEWQEVQEMQASSNDQ